MPLKKSNDPLKKALRLLVLIYRSIFSTWFGGACRFYPSCSSYALEALEQLPTATATKLILVRLCKCHPFGPQGWDPVPNQTAAKNTYLHLQQEGR